MKHLKFLLLAIVSLSFCLCFSSCGDDDEDTDVTLTGQIYYDPSYASDAQTTVCVHFTTSNTYQMYFLYAKTLQKTSDTPIATGTYQYDSKTGGITFGKEEMKLNMFVICLWTGQHDKDNITLHGERGVYGLWLTDYNGTYVRKK